MELKSKQEILTYLKDNGATESNLCEICETDRNYFIIMGDIDSSVITDDTLGLVIVKSLDGYFSLDMVSFSEYNTEIFDVNSVQDLSIEDVYHYYSKVKQAVKSYKQMMNL